MKFVTSNANKLRELRIHLPNLEQLDIDLPEIQSLDPYEIITAKLEAAREHTNEDIIVEDTSLTLTCLGRLPGPFIKHFLAELTANGIVELASHYDNQHATARTIIGYATSDHVEFFEGTVEGRIVPSRGDVAFGWDGIFEPEGYEKTYAELGDEKHTMSHRARAIEKLLSHVQNE